MLKFINKTLIREKVAIYFVAGCLFLFGAMYASCDANESSGKKTALLNSFASSESSGQILFSNQTDAAPLETPDLKIMQENTLCRVTTPCVISGKVLGDVFGNNPKSKKEINDYIVQPGDTLQSIADANGISVNTLVWANDLTTSSSVKVGQSLVILPTDGVLHVVKSGDTMSAIASKYKSDSENIIAFNDLANQNDIYIGDILVVPGGVMPKKAAPVINNQIPLADGFFIYPVQGQISQGLHYYNAIDIRNKCGTPVFSAAAGIVQRVAADGGYNSGMGNHITILHNNGTVTYYGHLMKVLVKPGDKVYTGQNIALMGGQPGMAGAGRSTGCHLHFQVVGAKNPLSKYGVGTNISYK